MTDQTRTLPNWASVKILDGGLCTQVAEKREYSSNINEECVRAWGRGDGVHFPPLANLNQAFGRWKKQASEKMARVTQKKKKNTIILGIIIIKQCNKQGGGSCLPCLLSDYERETMTILIVVVIAILN